MSLHFSKQKLIVYSLGQTSLIEQVLRQVLRPGHQSSNAVISHHYSQSVGNLGRESGTHSGLVNSELGLGSGPVASDCYSRGYLCQVTYHQQTESATAEAPWFVSWFELRSEMLLQ